MPCLISLGKSKFKSILLRGKLRSKEHSYGLKVPDSAGGSFIIPCREVQGKEHS